MYRYKNEVHLTKNVMITSVSLCNFVVAMTVSQKLSFTSSYIKVAYEGC